MSASRNQQRLSLGLDVGSQSLSGLVLDIDSAQVIYSGSVDYYRDGRLAGFGIRSDYLIPPRVPGEADQPPELYLAALEALLADMQQAGIALAEIVAINTSGQQHGHVYLNRQARESFNLLQQPGLAGSPLVELLQGSFAYGTAPIWMTSNTGRQAKHVKKQVGGKKAIVRLSGSAAPLRFTGAVIRRVGEQFPQAYEQTDTIQLISSFVPAVLTGNARVPTDFGNACGMTLMNYRKREWSSKLVRATADGLPSGTKGLLARLPKLTAPDSLVGPIATYFVEKYGFSPQAQVVAGSGDNPQAKVMVEGDLLSLGTSFVFMVATDGQTVDLSGLANAMYDGLGQPFMFGCRTNGALVWDGVRAKYGFAKDDYAPGEAALHSTPPGRYLVFWQPKNESFPPSGSFPLTQLAYGPGDFASHYAGVIESSLAAVYMHSRGSRSPASGPCTLPAGPRRARKSSAAWPRFGTGRWWPWTNRARPWAPRSPVLLPIAGPAAKPSTRKRCARSSSAATTRCSPGPTMSSAFHLAGGYLEKFGPAEADLIAKYPLS